MEDDCRARIVPTILLHLHHPWRSDAGGTTPGKGEVESRQEQRSRATQGAVAENRVGRPAGTQEVRATQEQLPEQRPRCRHIQGARWKMRAGILDGTSSPFFERNAVNAGRSATAAESWGELQTNRGAAVSDGW